MHAALRSTRSQPRRASSVDPFPSSRKPITHLKQHGEPMPKYQVLMNENARYMDESDRSDHGVFANAEEAIAACKAMVDDELATMHRPGMSAKELYRLYVGFGPDPFVWRSTRPIQT